MHVVVGSDAKAELREANAWRDKLADKVIELESQNDELRGRLKNCEDALRERMGTDFSAPATPPKEGCADPILRREGVTRDVATALSTTDEAIVDRLVAARTEPGKPMGRKDARIDDLNGALQSCKESLSCAYKLHEDDRHNLKGVSGALIDAGDIPVHDDDLGKSVRLLVEMRDRLRRTLKK